MKYTNTLERSIQILDLMIPKDSFKVGVLYQNAEQITEQEILSNHCGSPRYERVSIPSQFHGMIELIDLVFEITRENCSVEKL